MVNIYQFAQQMEKDGEQYYRELANTSNDKGLQSIFHALADDEVKHFRLFKEMEKGADPDWASSEVFDKAKNIFAEKREVRETYDFSDKQVTAYLKARDMEERAETFFREKAGEMENPYQKELLMNLAEEERKHRILIENIIEFISKPESWLENAEFHHSDPF